MPEQPKPQSTGQQSAVKTTTQIAGAMSIGAAMAILTIELLENTTAYVATAQVGVALGVVWNAVLNRLARWYT